MKKSNKATTTAKQSKAVSTVALNNNGLITISKNYSDNVKSVFVSVNNEIKSGKGFLFSARLVMVNLTEVKTAELELIVSGLAVAQKSFTDNGLEGASSFNRWLAFYRTILKTPITIAEDSKGVDFEVMTQKDIIEWVKMYSDNGNNGKQKTHTLNAEVVTAPTLKDVLTQVNEEAETALTITELVHDAEVEAVNDIKTSSNDDIITMVLDQLEAAKDLTADDLKALDADILNRLHVLLSASLAV